MKKFLAAVALLIAVTSCSAKGSITVNGSKVSVNDGLYALFQTNQGDVLVRLHMDKAPLTVANFVALAEGKHPLTVVKKGEPFFDGLIFHRCIPDFMIQGGDPDGTGMGGPGYSFSDEFDATLRHDTVGILSMANSGPATNGSQFFITEKATPWLDGRHSVFGKVIAGHEKMGAISRLPQNSSNKPNADVLLQKVVIVRVGKAAEAFDAAKTFTDKSATQAAEQAKKSAAAALVGQERAAHFTWMGDGGIVDQSAYDKAFSLWSTKARTSSSGLKVIIIKEGAGAVVEAGRSVWVHYAGYLSNGKPFDTSVKEVALLMNSYDPRREPYEAFSVIAGPQGQVIEGWKQGLIGLKQGTHAKLIIPPSLGYGAQDLGVIPPNSTLVFDVWIEDVK